MKNFPQTCQISWEWHIRIPHYFLAWLAAKPTSWKWNWQELRWMTKAWHTSSSNQRKHVKCNVKLECWWSISKSSLHGTVFLYTSTFLTTARRKNSVLFRISIYIMHLYFQSFVLESTMRIHPVLISVLVLKNRIHGDPGKNMVNVPNPVDKGCK